MTKFIIIGLLLLTVNCNALDFKPVKLSGNTQYTQIGDSKSLFTTIVLKYNFQLYETSDKKFLFYVGGKITTDYNHFGNQIKNNAYTVFGIDF